MALIEVSVTAGFGHASHESPAPVILTEEAIRAVSPQKQSPTTTLACAPSVPAKEGEYKPTSWYTRSVARLDLKGIKSIGVHGWKQTDVKSHSMTWKSDAKNTTNDFWIFRYKLDKEIKEVSLDVGGDRSKIDLTGTGTDGGLILAVYEGSAPLTLFKGNEIGVGKPAFLKKWPKPAPIELRATVAFRSAVKEFSVVLVGVDPWPNAEVNIQICRLRVLAKLSNAPPTKK
jgi:hypothetical protein